MSASIKKMIIDILTGTSMPVSGSAYRMDEMQKKIDDLSDENNKLKRLYLKSSVDMNSLQEIVKIMAMNQAQIASDLHTIYTSVRDAGIMEDLDESYDEEQIESTAMTVMTWNTKSGSIGGTGGMMN